MLRSTALLFAVLSGAVPAHGQGEIIDRVFAIVGGEIVTQSDVDAAIALGLADASGSPDPRGAALETLIARELTLREVRRYLPPEPAEEIVDRRVAAIRERFVSAEEFEGLMALLGVDERRLRARVRDDLRIQAYLDERFASPTQPTDEDILAYLAEHPDEFTRNGEVRPLAEVRGEVRRRLEAERRNAMIADWLTGLRRRSEVTVLYRTSTTPSAETPSRR